MPLPPTMSYPVQDKSFVVTRSYVSQLWFAMNGLLGYTQTNNVFEFTYSPIPTYRAWVVFLPNFWAWNSNHYTLDRMVQYAYETYSSGGTEFSVSLSIKYLYDPAEGRHTIYVATVSPSLNPKFILPTSSAPYWSPNGEGVVP